MVESPSSESGPSGSGSGDTEAPLLLIPRPQFQLRSLGIRQRWEVTRRHPYYQISWKFAQDHHRREPTRTELEAMLRQVAIIQLAAIGVTGETPDPATAFEDLGAADLNQAWLSGAVHPITFRGMAGLFLAYLPAETLSRLGRVFSDAARDDEHGKPPMKFEAIDSLANLDDQNLNCYPKEPFVSINPAASQRQIEASLSSLLPQWKAEKEIREQRDRSDKFEDYLLAWDLREGWNQSRYDRNCELKLKEVADHLRKPITTIANHYRQAFKSIVGHSYSPECWCRIFGFLKLGELVEEVGQVSRRRPLSSPVPRPIPESRLLSGQCDDKVTGPASSIADSVGAVDVTHLIDRIRELVREGRDDGQILGELDLSEAAREAVSYLRARADDPL